MATTEDALTTVVNAQNQQKVNELTGMANGAANTTTPAPAVNTATATPVATPAATTPATPAAMTTQNRIGEINNMYAAQQAARQAELQSGYDIARSDLQAAADKINPQFQQQANANAVDWERMRRNFLEGANMSGVNTGAGSQAELHMMGQQQRGQNTLRAAQAGQEAESARQMANLTAQYQANIQKAAAEADYQKAAALLDEYQKGYERDLKNAQVLAEFGDFEGYKGLYGDEAGQRMADFWAQQNPDIAYVTGRITKDQRDNIKGGRPINDGLDENGVRIVPIAGGGGGYSNYNAADNMRRELSQMYNSIENPTAADYTSYMNAMSTVNF